jgi:phosphoglycerol transferase MdoB-like AlkP superfamily enzyme
MANTKSLGFLAALVGFILLFIYPGVIVVIVLTAAASPGTFINWEVLLPDLISWIVGLVLLILGVLLYVEGSFNDNKSKAIALVSLVFGILLTFFYPGFILFISLPLIMQYGILPNLRGGFFLYFTFWVIGLILLILSIIILIKVYGTKRQLKEMERSKKKLEEDLEKIDISADISGAFAPNRCPKCGGWFPSRMYRCEICGYEREE